MYDIDQEIKQAEIILSRLKEKRKRMSNPKYKAIVEWPYMKPICRDLGCGNCVFDKPNGGCIIGDIGELIGTARELIEKNGGSIEKSS